MAQDSIDEAINAFKRSLSGVDGIAGDLKRAISNIEKTSIEQMQKQSNASKKSSSSSSSSESSSQKSSGDITKSLNMPITDPAMAKALAKQHANYFKGKGEFRGLNKRQTEKKLYEEIMESSKAEERKDISFGYGKEPNSWEKGDKDFRTFYHSVERRAYKLLGRDKAPEFISKYSKPDFDKHLNRQFQFDLVGAKAELDIFEDEKKEKEKAEIKERQAFLQKEAERKEAKADAKYEESRREAKLRELRQEFKETEREIKAEERQQALALKERGQLQTAVGNDLIQGSAGMAMGVALNKPTIIFASLATSAAKVTSRFGMLGKALAGVISILSAIGATAHVLTGRTNDNILKGAKSHISPETANAITAVGKNLLGDPDALMGAVNSITDLKATISNPVGFSQQLARITSSGAGAILAKHGVNALDVLNKINGSTTEEAMTWLGEKFLPKFKNSNELLEVSKALGVTDLANANIQLKTTFGKNTGIMQEVREVKESAGQLTAEAKAQQYKTGKEGAIASAKWGINNVTATIFGSAVEKFEKAVGKLSDIVAGGKGNNTKQINAMDNLRSGKINSLKDMQTLLNNSQFSDTADIFDYFVNADIESSATLVEYSKLKPLQDRARTLQGQIQNLPKKQQEGAKAKFLNESLITSRILSISNGENVAQGVRYENEKTSNATTNVNVIVTDKTQNGITARHSGGN